MLSCVQEALDGIEFVAFDDPLVQEAIKVRRILGYVNDTASFELLYSAVIPIRLLVSVPTYPQKQAQQHSHKRKDIIHDCRGRWNLFPIFPESWVTSPANEYFDHYQAEGSQVTLRPSPLNLAHITAPT